MGKELFGVNPTGVSKVLVLVFTDLAGSTVLKAEKGDHTAGALIARYREHVIDQSRQTDGRIIDWAGDGCFLTFEKPSSAVLFALNLQQAHVKEIDLPRIYVGIHMGEVFEYSRSEFEHGPPRIEGLAVDTAARIQSLALPGQILMSGAVFNSARQRLNSQSLDIPVSWQAHGAYHFEDFDDFVQIGEAGLEGFSPFKPPVGTNRVKRATTRLEDNTLGWRPAPGLALPGRADIRLVSHLGSGGFGEIWLAVNLVNQNRHVFKFCFQPDRLKGLKREVVLLRLLKESLGNRKDIARVLSWELEKQPYFIETEYTEGGDLKTWAAGQGGISAVPLKTRIELVAQTSVALSAAHSAGILHKDIKPTNILIVQPRGAKMPRVVLMDFGIGLLTDPESLEKWNITATGLTQTMVSASSTTGSGTVLYMAPELSEGKPPTRRSDVYSLGVLLYQMVIGDLSRALAPGWEQNVRDPLLSEDIAACVQGKIEERLDDPATLAMRLRSLDERRIIQERHSKAEKDRTDAERRRRRIQIRKQAMKSWAYEKVLPKIRVLLEDGQYTDAYMLARKAKPHIPKEPALDQYLEESSGIINIATSPPGAMVSYKPYTDFDGEWNEVGVTPMESLQLPAGMHRWRIQKDGYQERELAAPIAPTGSIAEGYRERSENLYFVLHEAGRFPPEMVSVDGGEFLTAMQEFPVAFQHFEPFLIDRIEVTNKAFKQFVDAGGYSNPKYWKHAFWKEGNLLEWAEAVKFFVDQTGRPGPSTWEVGDFPEGQNDYPVSGVSWFEAAAYADFKGKDLPTIYHWYRATYSFAELVVPITPLIISQSNFEGKGPAPAGVYPGIGSSGACDLAGNVREWCWNEMGGKRCILGGMWQDPSYILNHVVTLSAWDRSAGNGCRCVLYPEGTTQPGEFFQELNLGIHDPYSIPPVPMEIYRTIKKMRSYSPTPLRAVRKSEVGQGKKCEIVTIDAAYGKERLPLHLDLPISGQTPFKAVIYFPGLDAFLLNRFGQSPLWAPWHTIPKSGRALVTPVYSGTFERGGGTPIDLRPKRLDEYFSEWIKDLGRAIDYLESRDDIDVHSLSFLGLSMGGSMGPFLAAYENRINSLILVSGSLSFPAAQPKPKGQVLSHVTIPTLMLNGRFDPLNPVETHQKPLFDLLGTPLEHKRWIIYDAGHLPLPRAEMLKEIMAWLDKYQGCK
jgi:eukaryotic-like serine/threonine-protein kinase